jgi:hypothetical protein
MSAEVIVQAGLEPRPSRAEAAERLWSCALVDTNLQRDITKTDYQEIARHLLEAGSGDEQHTAAGLLACMARSKDPMAMKSADKLLTNGTKRLLLALSKIVSESEGHPRSKVRHCRMIAVYVYFDQMQVTSRRPGAPCGVQARVNGARANAGHGGGPAAGARDAPGRCAVPRAGHPRAACAAGHARARLGGARAAQCARKRSRGAAANCSGAWAPECDADAAVRPARGGADAARICGRGADAAGARAAGAI